MITYWDQQALEMIGGDPQQVESDIAAAQKKEAERAESGKRNTILGVAALAGLWFWWKKNKRSMTSASGGAA